MKNVVSRFIGRHEKELNPDLVKMSVYYGFSVNVTNCFSPEEKGSVESAVKYIRNQVFARRYAFDTLKEAQDHLAERLAGLNAGSRLEEERRHLLPYRPPLEIGQISEAVADKYSLVRFDNCFYSVPDHLVGRRLVVKAYPAEVVIYAGLGEVARHRRLKGCQEYSVDILHYLDTLARKPGAVKSSVALKSQARLKAVFDESFACRTRDFVALLAKYADRPIDEIADRIASDAAGIATAFACPASTIAENVAANTRRGLVALSEAFFKRGRAGCRLANQQHP